MKVLRLASLTGVLCALMVAGSGATGQVDKKFEGKERLSALQLYQAGQPITAIKRTMGKLVTFDVVVSIERQTPLVEVVAPARMILKDRQPNPIKAHLVTATTIASNLKKGDQVRIEGMIVDEGFDAYTIYLHRVVAKP
jgi:hypothetical protein